VSRRGTYTARPEVSTIRRRAKTCRSTTDKPRPWQTDGVECRGGKYRTAYSRRAGAVVVCALEAWSVFCRARELLTQSRELLNQVQAGCAGGFMVYGVHPPDFF
jgi:hypothetical protein